MKTLFASLFAALFVLSSLAAHAMSPYQPGTIVASSDDSTDGVKTPTTDTDSKSDEDDKKKPEDDDKKS